MSGGTTSSSFVLHVGNEDQDAPHSLSHTLLGFFLELRISGGISSPSFVFHFGNEDWEEQDASHPLSHYIFLPFQASTQRATFSILIQDMENTFPGGKTEGFFQLTRIKTRSHCQEMRSGFYPHQLNALHESMDNSISPTSWVGGIPMKSGKERNLGSVEAAWLGNRHLWVTGTTWIWAGGS